MIRRIAVVAILILALALSMSAPVAAQDDNLDCSRTIIGCSGPGPEPEHPGDRGGYAQLLTLGVLICGVGFIGYKMTSAVRARDAQTIDE